MFELIILGMVILIILDIIALIYIFRSGYLDD